jgi:hypothetical protein
VTFNSALSGALPISVGSLGVGASTTVRLYFTAPEGVTKFSLVESGTVVSGGATTSFSASELVIP